MALVTHCMKREGMWWWLLTSVSNISLLRFGSDPTSSVSSPFLYLANSIFTVGEGGGEDDDDHLKGEQGKEK